MIQLFSFLALDLSLFCPTMVFSPGTMSKRDRGQQLHMPQHLPSSTHNDGIGSMKAHLRPTANQRTLELPAVPLDEPSTGRGALCPSLRRCILELSNPTNNGIAARLEHRPFILQIT